MPQRQRNARERAEIEGRRNVATKKKKKEKVDPGALEHAALSPLGFRLFAQPGISIRSSRTSSKQALSALQVSWSSFIPLDRAESEIFRGVVGVYAALVCSDAAEIPSSRPSVRHIYDGPSPLQPAETG
ncbi:hypothetical protein K0M31_004093 [Melipona bicolor]|uniref:Uncharacterized protein n=1 Tax=Melipona bicolor TaxID=60889 RepID=A0AA40KP40_9HYME|nr:hypothetical protein K0M31_004093 [Melipona bicolor]